MTLSSDLASKPPTDPSPGGWDCHVHVFDAAAPVRPGHYTPADSPLSAIEQTAAAHGVTHLVLVQPSVYGTDNGVLLRALEAGQGRHRGIAVLDATLDPSALKRTMDRMHSLGVRGIRFNLVSPAGHPGGVAAAQADLEHLAPRLRERGWHVQCYVPAALLPTVARWQSASGLTFVLDHLAGLHATLSDTDDAWAAAQALADGGAWLKLSGWYRLGARAPYAALVPVLKRAAAGFGPRTVWGSDWPHTSFPADQRPVYESTIDPIRGALGEASLHEILGDHARSLYR